MSNILTKNKSQIIHRDLKVVWHPCTPPCAYAPCLPPFCLSSCPLSPSQDALQRAQSEQEGATPDAAAARRHRTDPGGLNSNR